MGAGRPVSATQSARNCSTAGTIVEQLQGRRALRAFLGAGLRLRLRRPRRPLAGDHTIGLGAFDGDQPLRDFLADQRRVAVQRIAPATATPGDEVQLVAFLDMDILDLVADDLGRAVGLFEDLARALAGLAAIDAPWGNEPAVVMDRDRCRSRGSDRSCGCRCRRGAGPRRRYRVRSRSVR